MARKRTHSRKGSHHAGKGAQLTALLALGALGCASTVPVSSGPGNVLDRYTPRSDSFELADVPTNLSGITWDSSAATYFVVTNSDAELYEYDVGLQNVLRKMHLENGPSDDFEAIVYLGDSRFMLATEENQAVIVEMPADRSISTLDVDPARPDVQGFELPERGSWNAGIEGLCYAPGATPGAGTFYALQERSPRRIYRFERPSHGNDVSVHDGTLAVTEPFDAEVVFAGIAEDLSGCTYDPRTGHLIVTSHASSAMVEVNLAGQVLAVEDLGGQLSGGAFQWEGVALGENDSLYTVSEPFFLTRGSRARIYDDAP